MDVSLLADGPTARFTPPSHELAEEKRRFAPPPAARWFGTP